jgi:enoyl-CoA hydratase
MADNLSFEVVDDVALITLDDGKANALGFEMFSLLDDALDQAVSQAQATVLLGRPGVLSGGFDLNVIRSGNPVEIEKLVRCGVRMLMKLFGHEQPLVVGTAGHAVALGAFLLLSADYRIGVEGNFKIGLNETAIGLTLPAFGVELARARLSPLYLSRSAIVAELFEPQKAIEVGFLDQVVDDSNLLASNLKTIAIEKAQSLAPLDSKAYACNKKAFRGEIIERVLASIA